MANRVQQTAVGVFFMTAVWASVPLIAHHGTNASYDLSQSVTLTGTVTEWVFVNPHAQLYFDVTDNTGKLVHWGGELNSPTNLRRDGWTKEAFKAGDKITLSVNPARAGTPVGVVDRSKPVIVNGKELPGRTVAGGGYVAPVIVTLAVTSTSFTDGGEIPAKYAGQQGTSPQLSWTGAPAATKNFVLVMHDVDAAIPAGNVTNDITHWVIWNIPATTTSIAEGGPIPAGANQSSLRGPQYMGPAPPPGHPYHHYVFQVYALSATIDVAAGGTRTDVEKAMEGKILARGAYLGRARSR
jgi:Raf kinase inhibitor-like YbhB/YbcL family protein